MASCWMCVVESAISRLFGKDWHAVTDHVMDCDSGTVIGSGRCFNMYKGHISSGRMEELDTMMIYIEAYTWTFESNYFKFIYDLALIL